MCFSWPLVIFFLSIASNRIPVDGSLTTSTDNNAHERIVRADGRGIFFRAGRCTPYARVYCIAFRCQDERQPTDTPLQFDETKSY